MSAQTAPGPRRRLFNDDSLTQKASMNALVVMLDYGARLLVGFVTTPLLVKGLGAFLFGTWQVLNRMMGYITASSGRPTQALKWTIARDQASADPDRKRDYVGSAFVVWAWFLPLMLALGAVLVWKVPAWLKVPPELVWPVRAAAGILVANLAISSLSEIPISVLQGENLGYKRMGLTTATVLLGGGLFWLAMELKAGIVGVCAAVLVATLATGAVFLVTVKKYAPWFGMSFPPAKETRKFFGLSVWFLGWNLIMNLMTASDIVILGVLDSAAAVTGYSLSKYAPEALISIIALVNFGITPGLGRIIGQGDLKKAAQIRGEMMALTWLVTTSCGATILAWNRAFLGLWVGRGHEVGPLAALMITLVVTQFVLIRCDSGIIDLSLDLRRKVLMGFGSAGAAIVLAALFVGHFKWGVVGLCAGMILGRLILSVEYPSIAGRSLGISPASQLKYIVRPGLVTALLYAAAPRLDRIIGLGGGPKALAWIKLAAGVAATALALTAAAFVLGFNADQRRTVLRRLRSVVSLGRGKTA